jgi:hypothetical protein
VLIIPSSWGSQLDGEKPSTPRHISAPVPSPTGLLPRAAAPYYPSQQPPTVLRASGQSVLPNGEGLHVRPLLLPQVATAGTVAASVDVVVVATVACATATRLLPSSPRLRRPGPRANMPGPESSTTTPCRCPDPHTPASCGPDQQPTRCS